jgi:uncharacterized protein YceK
MKNMVVFITIAAIINILLAGCSPPIKKTETNTYSTSYTSYKSEDDARKQALVEARFECSRQGKELNILKEEKKQKRGFVFNLEFECVDYIKGTK